MAFIEINNLRHSYENDDMTKEETLKGLSFTVEKANL